MEIREARAADVEPLALILARIESFTKDEVVCAREVLEAAVAANAVDYQALVATDSRALLGYVCFGPTPMTESTFDLYWIASAPNERGRGIGSALLSAMESRLCQRQARIVRVETSATEAYGPTRGFYERNNYREEARIADFYRPGDDLVILTKRLETASSSP